MFTFRGPSKVGDRLLLRAIVNNAFKSRYECPAADGQQEGRGAVVAGTFAWLMHSVLCSLEVGVRAEAYQEEGPNRHINSAFMTFEVLDKSGKPCALPRIRPEPVVSQLIMTSRGLETGLETLELHIHKRHYWASQLIISGFCFLFFCKASNKVILRVYTRNAKQKNTKKTIYLW